MSTVDARLHRVPAAPGETVKDYRKLFLSGCALLDVRAPVEFAKGAFPGSVNLPLMSDDERHQVGICYKEEGQESAIALGARLVTSEIQRERVGLWQAFLQEHPDARLYCFRGGLRSRITQQWLADAGVHVPLVVGGYKALRSFLLAELQRLSESLAFTLIGGRTGNGKTLLLKELTSKLDGDGHDASGDDADSESAIHGSWSVLDLEGLANHRGSSFGSMPSAQPRTIDFENALAIELMRVEAHGSTHVFLEDEARLIGRICIPDALRDRMQNAPIYSLECDMPDRITNCFGDYVTDLLQRYQLQFGLEAGFDAYSKHHRGSLERIQKRFGSENYQRALGLLNDALQLHREHEDDSAYAPFIEMLLRDYYDPMYDYQLSKKASRVLFTGTREEILEHFSRRKTGAQT